jgi:hypothetical protein
MKLSKFTLVPVFMFLTAFQVAATESFASIPKDVMFLVIQHEALSPADLARNEKVSKYWKSILRHEQRGWRAKIAARSSALIGNLAPLAKLSMTLMGALSQSWCQLKSQEFIDLVSTELVKKGMKHIVASEEEGARLDRPLGARCIVAAERLGNHFDVMTAISGIWVRDQDDGRHVFQKTKSHLLNAGSEIAKSFK